MSTLLILFFFNSFQIQNYQNDLDQLRSEIITRARIPSERDSALLLGRKRLEISEKLGHSSEIIASESLIAGVYRLQADTTQAIAYYKKAIKHCTEYDLENLAPRLYDLLGRFYREINMPNLATNCHLRSLEMRELSMDVEGIAKSNMYLGRINSSLSLNREALINFESAYGTFLGLSDSLQMKRALNAVINELTKLDSLDQAYRLIEDYGSLVDTGTKQEQINYLHLLSLNYLNRDRYDSAFEIGTQELSLQKNVQDPKIINTHINLGYALIKLEDYELGEYHLRQAESQVKSNSELRTQSRLYSNLHLLLVENGSNDTKSKYYYVLKVDSLRRIINEENKLKVSLGLQLKYESGKKDAQIESQAMRLRLRKRNQILTSVLSGVIFILMGLRYSAVKRLSKKNKKLHDQEINQLLAHEEIKVIEAMIEGQEKERERMAEDLHDKLGSTLSATTMHLDALEEKIYNEEAKTEKIRSLLDKAITDTREIAHNLKSAVLKFGIIPALNDLRDTVVSANRVNMEIDAINFDKHLSPEEELQIYRIIQELVSNALKHAYAGRLDLTLKKFENGHRIEFKDDGIGFDTSELARGIGLKNIQSRAQKIKAKLDISSGEEGTTVIIDLAA